MYSPNDSPCAASFTLDGALWAKYDNTTTSLIFEKVSPLPKDLIQEHLSTGSKNVIRPLPVRQEIADSPNPKLYHDLPSNLVLNLGECMAVGRSGIIFPVEPVGLPSDSPNATLPPLIAKIGRQHYNKWLLREAWFYDEMQSLQGVVIPWCYGLYSARIPVTPSHAFMPWLEGWKRRIFRNDVQDLETVLKSYEEYDGKDNDDSDVINNGMERYYLDTFSKFRDEYGDLVKQFEDEHQSGQRTIVVTILVLERLGETYLPLGGRNWPMGKPIPDDMTREVHYAYNRIHELGITHMDIKRLNILKAPERETVDEGSGPDSVPNVRACECRIIDFELSKKDNFTVQILEYGDGQYIDRMIDNLPTGSSIGQSS